MTKSESDRVTKYIGDLCVMLDITPPQSIFKSELRYAYVCKTSVEYVKYGYIDNYRLPKRRLIKRKIYRKIRDTDNADYDLYLTKREIEFIKYKHTGTDSLFNKEMDSVLHELTHIKYGINVHSHKFFKYMDKLKALYINKFYSDDNNKRHTSCIIIYSSKEKPRVLKRLRKTKTLGYYNVSYDSIIKGVSPYVHDVDKLRAFNNKWNKSKYIGGKR